MLSFVTAEEDLRIKTSCPLNEATAVFMLKNLCYLCYHTSHSDEPLSYQHIIIINYCPTTCYQGKQLRGIYTFGMKNFTAKETLNFEMPLETNEKMKNCLPNTTHCGCFLQMEDPQSKRHGLVLQCNKTSTNRKPLVIEYNYTCTYSGALLTVSTTPPVGQSKSKLMIL